MARFHSFWKENKNEQFKHDDTGASRRKSGFDFFRKKYTYIDEEMDEENKEFGSIQYCDVCQSYFYEEDIQKDKDGEWCPECGVSIEKEGN